MRRLRTTTRRNSPRGQVIIEAVLALPLLIGLFVGSLFLTLSLLGRELLRIDSYSLARAHLYGNDLEICHASSLWPSINGLRVEMKCPANARVDGRLLFRGRLLAGLTVNLETSAP